MNAAQMPAHMFLAAMGKTMLRPGGFRTTKRIVDYLQLTPESTVLEVAPNMGTTSVYLAKTYGCKIVAMDIHGPSLERAKENIKNAGVEHLVTLVMGDARRLPFEDESFDAVINEAMLTILPNKEKGKALNEYYRVLKPEGRLGTHDIMFKSAPTPEQLDQYRDTVKMIADPKSEGEWKEIFANTPFSHVELVSGPMTFMSIDTLLKEEGWEGTIKILQNAMGSEETQERFISLATYFNTNHDVFGHGIILAQK